MRASDLLYAGFGLVASVAIAVFAAGYIIATWSEGDPADPAEERERPALTKPVEFGVAHVDGDLEVKVSQARVVGSTLEVEFLARSASAAALAVTEPRAEGRPMRPRLKDDTGRRLHWLGDDAWSRSHGEPETGDATLRYVARFRAPSRRCRLILTIDMAMFGGQGRVRFSIPRRKIS